MKILYAGHYGEGSTSKMRGQCLKRLLPFSCFKLVDIDKVINKYSRVLRSAGWRYKIGPMITDINSDLLETLNTENSFDLVWIDKGVFFKPEVIRAIKNKTKLLVHFTPDPAFTYHKSRFFKKALPMYDFCITTKSFELEHYRKNGARKILTATQGFDPEVHKPFYPFSAKSGVSFIGHWEDNREAGIAKLMEKNIHVKLAGIKWEKFVNKHRTNRNLTYLGNGVFGSDYAKILSESYISLGFLSKIIPERHTTRTFEIPACGTALATEYNEEIAAVYSEDEVIYFDNTNEMVEKIEYGLNHLDWLEKLTEKGMVKVINGGFSYEEILKKLLKKMDIEVLCG